MNPFILLQAGGAAAKGSGSMTLLFILAIILIFYLFMIRPQQKRQKEMEDFRSSLGKGDQITTIGGIHGKIKEVKELTFLVEIANDIVIEIEKAAVSISDAQLKQKKEEAKNK